MKKIPLYQIDAFTDKVFHGNPAAVCPLEKWLDDTTLQNIAAENNLSETAFFVNQNSHYELRWFTPRFEIDLCGHATLASGYVIFNYLKHTSDTIKFKTKSGELLVSRSGSLISLNFPAWKARKIAVPDILVQALCAAPSELYETRDWIAVYTDEEQIRSMKPDFALLEKIDCICTIVTAPGTQSDFVSRAFVPKAGIPEDPVTGSAHSSLIPYWSERLNKKSLKAIQLSQRVGTLYCEHLGDRVLMSGYCAPYSEGFITI